MRFAARFLPALLVPMTLLAGCAAGPNLDQRLMGFIGRSELELVGTLGVPARSYEVSGRKFLLFEDRRAVTVGVDPWGWGPRGYGFGPRGGWGGWGGGSEVAVLGCDVTFALHEGRVEGFTHRGQGCA